MTGRLSPAAVELLGLLEGRLEETARRYRARLQRMVVPYRTFPAAIIEENAAQLARLFVRLLRSEGADFQSELEQWVRERAALGIGPGDGVMAVVLLAACAREVVIEQVPDVALRGALAGWSEIEQTAAAVAGWIAERFGAALAAPSA